MSQSPALELPIRPSFMIIDGKTFIIEQIEQSPHDMLKNVEEFYNQNLEELRAKVSKHLSEESQVDLDTQVKRIERHLASGIVALPEGLQGSGHVLFLQANKVYESKIVLFKPSRISCTLQRVEQFCAWIESEISRRDAERYTKFIEWARPLITHYRGLNRDLSSIKMDITVHQDLVIIPMVVAYCTVEQKIFVTPYMQHPHCYGDASLCTGNTNARHFWDDGGFIENFNSMNPHSFANSDCTAAQNHRQMLKNQYFIEGRVREQEATAWRVS